MPEPHLDPSGFYELDLPRGTVRTRAGERVVVMADHVARALFAAAEPSAARQLGEAVATEAMRHLDDLPDATPERVLGEAAAALGVFGWGRLGLERWGDALVATLDDLPAGVDAASEAILSGFFSRLSGREVACAAAGRGKYLLVDPSVAPQVRAWAAEGASVPAIVERLGRAE